MNFVKYFRKASLLLWLLLNSTKARWKSRMTIPGQWVKEEQPSSGVLRNNCSEDLPKNPRKTPATDYMFCKPAICFLVYKKYSPFWIYFWVFRRFSKQSWLWNTYDSRLLVKSLKLWTVKLLAWNLTVYNLMKDILKLSSSMKFSFNKQTLDFNSVQLNQIEFSQNRFSALPSEI